MPLDLYRGDVLKLKTPAQMKQMAKVIAQKNMAIKWQLVVSELISYVLNRLPEKNLVELQMDARLEALLIFMQANTHRLLSNQELAQHCHLSEAAMIRLFSQQIGRSPQAFFSDMRLDQAAALLRQHPEDSIELIAEKTGFFDRSHFCKRFVTRYGISPVKYRKAP